MSNKDNKNTPHMQPYSHPAGGWGALNGVRKIFKFHQTSLQGIKALFKANHDRGFDCPGCAWPDRNDGQAVDSCENGMKAVAAEMTQRLATPEFFASCTLTDLRNQSDFELEDHGRLTHPLIYNEQTDTYQPIAWQEAFSKIGAELRAHDPNSLAFYTSGRTSNEAAFLWQLLARALGTNNLPDSSNLCHEPSGFALKEVIGTSKGTATLDDFDHADVIFVIGQNPASNHPRMMGVLHAAAKRGARIVAFNPLKERGFVNFSDPKNLTEMLTNSGIKVAKHVFQIKIGGDMAAFKGMMKALLEMDAHAMAHGKPSVLDHNFIRTHTTGFELLKSNIEAESWQQIYIESGLSRTEIDAATEIYANGERTIATWCMGITHHENSVATIQTILSFLMLRGNIGKPGSGAVPVRGHSNVQGVRTMGVMVAPPTAFLKNLETQFGIQAPRDPGRDAVSTVEGLIDGSIKGFIGLGGNFGAAAPDSQRTYAGFSNAELTVHVATKLNRSHCYPGKLGLLLPCLGRTDIDLQNGIEQFVTVEDSMSMVHRSYGMRPSRSTLMMSEPAIVANLGHATIGSAKIDWLGLATNYDRIRDDIECCMLDVVDGYQQFNARVRVPGGFRLTNHASQRIWKTPSHKAEFKVHSIATDGPIHRARTKEGDQVLALMTLRSHDQYNTTIYGLDDRYRGIFGGRNVMLVNPQDIKRLGFQPGDRVNARSIADDGIERMVHDFILVPYDIPRGCAASYFPEATPLIPIGLVSKKTRTPATKEIPIVLSLSRSTTAAVSKQER